MSNTPAYAAPSSFPRLAPSSLPGRLSIAVLVSLSGIVFSGIVSTSGIVFSGIVSTSGCRSVVVEVLV